MRPFTPNSCALRVVEGARSRQFARAGRIVAPQRRPSRPRLSTRLATTGGNRRRVDSLDGAGLGTRSWSSASRIHIGAAQLRLRPTAYPLALGAERVGTEDAPPFYGKRLPNQSATVARASGRWPSR